MKVMSTADKNYNGLCKCLAQEVFFLRVQAQRLGCKNKEILALNKKTMKVRCLDKP